MNLSIHIQSSRGSNDADDVYLEIEKLELTPIQYRLYNHLLVVSGWGESDVHKSQEDLSENCDISRTSVQRAMIQLEDRGLIYRSAPKVIEIKNLPPPR